MRVFVTGTDTGAGKTYFSCLLLEALKREGRDAAAFKPVVCGDRGDAYALQASGDPSIDLDTLNPTWFKTPAAPLVGAMIENRPVDLKKIRAAYRNLAGLYENIVVEGAGGWEVPVSPGFNMSNLAGELALPVIVVVDNKLGALNHTILTVNAVIARGLTCVGVVLNHVGEKRDSASISNRAVVEDTLDIPVILELMHGETEIDIPDELSSIA